MADLEHGLVWLVMKAVIGSVEKVWVFCSLSETGGEEGEERKTWGAEQRPFLAAKEKQRQSREAKQRGRPSPNLPSCIQPGGKPRSRQKPQLPSQNAVQQGPWWRAYPEAHPPHLGAIFSS